MHTEGPGAEDPIIPKPTPEQELEYERRAKIQQFLALDAEAYGEDFTRWIEVHADNFETFFEHASPETRAAWAKAVEQEDRLKMYSLAQAFRDYEEGQPGEPESLH